MSNLSDIDIAKFKAGFDQFQAEDVRKLFSVLKALVYNSSASAPLQMSVDEVQGITLGIQENVGQLVKAKAVIPDGATGKVILTDLLFNEIGDQFDALNFSGSATTNGQTKLVIGKDIAGGFFFRDSTGGGVCPTCDCSGATSFEECWDMGWQQGVSFLGGGFKTRASWTLLSGGMPVVGCEALAQALGSCTGAFPPDLTWQLDLLTEGTFGGVPYSNFSGGNIVDYYPYVQGYSVGTRNVFIPLPWGGSVDAEASPAMGIYGCTNSFDSIDLFTATRINTGDPCSFWDGIIPCDPFDPRPECSTCV